jgi:hypothetical protein
LPWESPAAAHTRVWMETEATAHTRVWMETEARVPRGTRSPLYRLKTRDLDMSGPGAGHVWLARYVWAKGWTCPVKTASTVLKTSETGQKIDIQWILA